MPPERYRARARRVWGDIELAYRALAVPIVAVTGTNGKSTTVRLLEAMLRAAGLRARAAGNVGDAALGLVGRAARRGRARGVLVPARDRRELPPARRGAAEPDARPPRPARRPRGLPRREGAHLREPGARGRRDPERRPRARRARREPRRARVLRFTARGARRARRLLGRRGGLPRGSTRSRSASRSKGCRGRAARSRENLLAALLAAQALGAEPREGARPRSRASARCRTAASWSPSAAACAS